jgi:hypothetical protein
MKEVRHRVWATSPVGGTGDDERSMGMFEVSVLVAAGAAAAAGRQALVAAEEVGMHWPLPEVVRRWSGLGFLADCHPDVWQSHWDIHSVPLSHS